LGDQALREKENRQLTGRTAAGATLLIASRLATKAIDFATLLVLARLLTPAEFGFVAVGMTLIFIVEAIFELPIYEVLMRQDITREHLDTAYTLGIIRGILLAIVLAALAVPFSIFYGDPRLIWLVSLLSLAPAMRGLTNPRLALYGQKLDFRRDMIIEVLSKIAASILSITAAIVWRDYRAIIVGTLATPAFLIIVSFCIAPYRPKLTLRAWPIFSAFVGWSTGSQILAALNWQCDRLILAKFVDHTRLGDYSLANDLSYLPEQALIKPIIRPLLSAFAEIKEEGKRLSSAYVKASTSILAIGLPVMVGLSMLAHPAVAVALGAKWDRAVPILQWLSLSLIPPLFTAPFPSLAMALGKPELVTRQSATEAIVKLPLVTLGAIFFAIPGVVVARFASTILVLFVSLFYVRRLIGTPIYRQLSSAWRVVVSGAMLAVTLQLLRPLLEGWSIPVTAVLLLAAASAGMVAYLVTLAVLWHFSHRPEGIEHAVYERFRLLTNRIRRVEPTPESSD